VTISEGGFRSFFQAISNQSVEVFSGASAGLLLIAGGAQTGTQNMAAVIAYRAASSPFCVPVAARADIETTTGELTGTTGSDGVVTVSVDDSGNIYVENRHGGTRTLRIFIIR
jgi:hypothetical protein